MGSCHVKARRNCVTSNTQGSDVVQNERYENYFLALVWNANEGVQLHAEIDGTLSREDSLKLETDIARIAEQINDLN
jgi:hypothetical protein